MARREDVNRAERGFDWTPGVRTGADSFIKLLLNQEEEEEKEKREEEEKREKEEKEKKEAEEDLERKHSQALRETEERMIKMMEDCTKAVEDAKKECNDIVDACKKKYEEKEKKEKAENAAKLAAIESTIKEMVEMQKKVDKKREDDCLENAKNIEILLQEAKTEKEKDKKNIIDETLEENASIGGKMSKIAEKVGKFFWNLENPVFEAFEAEAQATIYIPHIF